MRELLLMGRSHRSAEPFESLRSAADIHLWFSYGESIPKLSENFLFWGAGKYAAGLKLLLPERRFQSPGAAWLPGLPKEFLGRDISTGSFQELLEEPPTSAWVKLAELKHENFKPGLRSAEELRGLGELLPELTSASVQWTETILELDFEHRFFVANGEVVTGSPYLMGGEIYDPTSGWTSLTPAENFAKLVAKELAPSSSPAYTLDVGWDRSSERWVVIEANRVWSSGIYGAALAPFLEALELSLTASLWEWEPDEAVATYAKRPNFGDENSAGLFLLGGKDNL